jgi:hypothetical protein
MLGGQRACMGIGRIAAMSVDLPADGFVLGGLISEAVSAAQRPGEAHLTIENPEVAGDGDLPGSADAGVWMPGYGAREAQHRPQSVIPFLDAWSISVIADLLCTLGEHGILRFPSSHLPESSGRREGCGGICHVTYSCGGSETVWAQRVSAVP